MDIRKIFGIALIITGIGLPVYFFTLNIFFGLISVYLIGTACIMGGIYLSICTFNKFFIAGTIIIAVSSLITMMDYGFSARGWQGIYANYLALPAYFAGVLVTAYSIHIIGNKWAWLDFPLALIVGIGALLLVDAYPQPWEIQYRLAWLSVFPLNYVALLILFVILNRLKEK